MSDSTAPPYRAGMAAGLGVVLSAGLLVALVDVIHTGEAALVVLGLWALVVAPIAVGTGLVLGAGNATWGAGWVRAAFRRLRDDALDAYVTSIVVSAVISSGVFVGVTMVASNALVGDVQRKSTGGILLGIVLIGVLITCALLVLPIYRAVRTPIRVLPALGSRLVTIGGVGLIIGGLGFYLFLGRKLDLQALNLGSIFAMLAILPISIAIGLVAYGPLARTREAVPARGILAAVGLVIACILPVLGLRGTPTPDAAVAVRDHSYLGSRMIPLLQKLIDHDKDGYSAFFGGPDCDDTNGDVHPNGTEIPDNGIDENCVGGDGHKAALPPRIPDGGTQPPPVPTATVKAGNLLVIFVDTLRADRLGFTGYKRDDISLTPHIDAFAKDAVVFKNAFSQAPNTPRSVPSFMTSRYPSQVKYNKQFSAYPTILDENETIFETLTTAGFSTIGETSHFYFCDREKYPDTCKTVISWMKSNITQGTTEWDNTGAENIPESNKDVAGPRTVEKANKKLETLAKDKTKFAMLVHLFEPHSTYVVHPGFEKGGVKMSNITESGTKSLMQKYDYEVAFVDDMIGKLLDQLAATGLDKTTTVVLMADHGEAFGVHVVAGKPDFFHGDSLYAELTHVPLMFRVPGGKACMRDDVVGLIDLAPTIAALFDVKPAASWQGRSLAPAIACGELPKTAMFSELLRAPDWDHEGKAMITADNFHVYFRTSDSRWEVYDLDKDPEERTNIADGNPKLDQWKSELAAWIEGPLAAGGGK